MNRVIKKNRFIFLVIVFISWTNIACANFEITEIMYDLEKSDVGREWVEVKNTGGEPLDLSKWFFFSDNTKHSLRPIKEVTTLNPGEYTIITQNEINFIKDWPNYSGSIFDSSWTDFTNKGENIALKNPELELISFVSFSPDQGGKGNGNSLQKVNGHWQESKPTPGKENKIVKIVTTSTKNTTTPKTPSLNVVKNEKNIEQENEKPNSEVINLNNINSANETASKKINNSVLAWVGLGIIIVISLGATILIRKDQKKKYPKKRIRAKNIKIIK